MRRFVLVSIALVAFCLAYFLWHTPRDTTVFAYFQNAQGLQAGAQVRFRGIEVGTVTEIRVDASQANQPVSVRMSIAARNAGSIPSDALVSLEANGVLGPTIVEIDASHANGLPITQNATLRSVETNVDKAAAAHALEVMGNTMLKEAQKLKGEIQKNLRFQCRI